VISSRQAFDEYGLTGQRHGDLARNGGNIGVAGSGGHVVVRLWHPRKSSGKHHLTTSSSSVVSISPVDLLTQRIDARRRYKMRTIKALGLAFVAMLAFSSLGVSSASALLFLTKNPSELFLVLNLNSAGKPAILETAGTNKVECTFVLGHGIILNKTDIAEKILFTFHGCKQALAGACNSPGEPSGLITTLELDALLVTLLNGKYGILVLPEVKGGNAAFFSCGGVINVVVKGTVAGEFTETKAESEVEKEEGKVVFEKGAKAGEQAIKDVWTLQGIVADKLESSITGLFSESGESNEQAEGDIRTPFKVKFCHN
jgi:hypothetical protein